MLSHVCQLLSPIRYRLSFCWSDQSHWICPLFYWRVSSVDVCLRLCQINSKAPLNLIETARLSPAKEKKNDCLPCCPEPSSSADPQHHWSSQSHPSVPLWQHAEDAFRRDDGDRKCCDCRHPQQ